MFKALLALWVTLWSSLALLVAQSTGEPAAVPEKPLLVHIIGASVSGGFEYGPMIKAEAEQERTFSLQAVLKPWVGDAARLSSHPPLAMQLLFRSPLATGQQQVAVAKQRGAGLVVAVDFLFWFAYGYVGDQELVERKATLSQGLDLLAALDLPVVVGDLPDMRGANERMLNPRQVPSPEVLVALNQQIAEFVAKHPHLHLVSLASFVKELKAESLTLPLQAGDKQVAPAAMLQSDRLHARRLGMVYLGYQLQAALHAALPASHALRERSWKLEEFVQALDAQADLQALVGS